MATPVYPVPRVAYGAKYFHNYSFNDYYSQPQNWFITQDKQCMIYSANQEAVLKYDGVFWKKIPIPGKNARSLAVDDKDTIYIGGNNEIGFLKLNHLGQYLYVSLNHLLHPLQRDFGNVWRTYATGQGIYFCTTKYLFLFNGKHIKVWQTRTSFAPPFFCGEKLLVRQQGYGLMEMINGTLHLLPGGKAFAFEKLYAIVEFTPGTLLIGTSTNGFFLYNNNTFTPFKTEALDSIAMNQLTYGLRLSDGNFALGTLKGGVFIINNSGQLVFHFDTSLGLQDNTVWHIYEDSQKNLWLALNNGISKLEYRSPFSLYDPRHGLKGMVLCTARFGANGRLYAGTGSGLFVMNERGFFSAVPGIPGSCHALLAYQDEFLAATEKGVFRILEKSTASEKLNDYATLVFHVTGRVEHPILAGTTHGMICLSFNARTGQWQTQKFADTITEEIRTITQDTQGNLWLGSPREGVIKISFLSGQGPHNTIIQRFGPAYFPPEVETHVFHAAGHVIIATGKGIFQWGKKENRFIPDKTLGTEFTGGASGKSVFRIVEDDHKNIWFHSNARNLVAILQANGSYHVYNKIFLRVPINHVNAIYPDPLEKCIWFASVGALIRFDSAVDFAPHPPTPFRTFIRDVWANEILVSSSETGPFPGKASFPELPFNRRSLRFSFGAPFFEAEQETLYQCRLDGYDTQWTTWSRETRKDYTNLEPGLNAFRVRAKNVYGEISEEAVFRFRLLAPWYRTWWAYFFYVAVVSSLMALLVKWRSAQLLREKQHLETIVMDRTQEINRKNEQLQEMATLKSNFFANISHEFRTPLTLILGPLEQMIEMATDKQHQNKLKVMRRNAQRLLNLINQLLELSKLDSGTVTLNMVPRDIVSFFKGLTASFELLTTRNDQTLTFSAPVETCIVAFDVSRMEEVLCNLLINAIKFTPAGGSIACFVTPQTSESPGFPDGFVEMRVQDTGPGMPPSQMAKIFDRFYYSDNIHEYHQKGAGIGLSIAKELVELHHGTITVESTQGEPSGSRFIVRVPLDKTYLKPVEGFERHAFQALDEHEMDGLPSSFHLVEAETVTAEPPHMHESFGDEKEIILVVEDSADVCAYIRGALEPLYHVLEARDGQAGIEKALLFIPDLIVSDIMMPRMDGYTLCKTLKQDRNTSHIPIILLTAKASEENILAGLETGADDYVTKPFSTRILCARIKNLIDIRCQLQQNWSREMTLQPTTMTVSPVDKTFMKELKQVMEKNIDDCDFNVEQLSQKLLLSHASVYRKIHALTGETPTDFIRSYRLKQGAELLKKSKMSVLEVALEVGFSSANYFTKCFKNKFNQLPSEYRGDTR